MKFGELDPSERPKVNAFYQLTTYKRPVSESDRVFVAEDAGMIYGAVRIESIDGVQVLRGMYMHPDYLRQGIGRRLLKAIEPPLSETESFCIPRDNLFSFYGRAGFNVIDQNEAPSFLSKRLASYVEEGLPVAIMHRSQGEAY
ncbi:GNAT family N-acetyltransferase [Congregibacter litoralis]|uniref:N-acetylglutamate synthase n=1 Tax=Congregibacter litoralis KT71 TaxID=314285 RepID=A4A4N1_9GAMM|nr:GNAT family N-acetyltransferase [Congregibacter litoralis]EAQ98752.1 N-acetylglutamate synthase [Congregibacter litoralis KT71]